MRRIRFGRLAHVLLVALPPCLRESLEGSATFSGHPLCLVPAHSRRLTSLPRLRSPRPNRRLQPRPRLRRDVPLRPLRPAADPRHLLAPRPQHHLPYDGRRPVPALRQVRRGRRHLHPQGPQDWRLARVCLREVQV